ncbi:MAG: ABC transporter permease subunit, partial [Elusimicrobia bacterium]|nr:ABC transporter permease subunit [Elusimicrobiota bacterium]
ILGSMSLHLGETMRRVLAGLLLGGLPGIAFGVLAGFVPYVYALTEPWIHALMVTPKVALLSYFMLVLGLGDALSLTFIGSVVFLEMAVTVRAGIPAIPQDLLDTVRLLGATPRRVLADVVLPSLVPYLLLGTQLGFRQAIRQAILLESIFAFKGLGYQLWSSAERMQVHGYLAYLLVTAGLGIAVMGLFSRLLLVSSPWFDPHALRR